jgi:hypothetical protein
VSLEDQADNGKDTIKEMFRGPAEYKVIATKAKGEWVDRPELRELQQLIETNQFDVLFAEDLVVGRFKCRQGGALQNQPGYRSSHSTQV